MQSIVTNQTKSERHAATLLNTDNLEHMHRIFSGAPWRQGDATENLRGTATSSAAGFLSVNQDTRWLHTPAAAVPTAPRRIIKDK